jgi:hypothetical protein
MSDTEKIVRGTTKDGVEIGFLISTDPNWIPTYEYQDEDGNWVSSEEDIEESE